MFDAKSPRINIIEPSQAVATCNGYVTGFAKIYM